MFVMLDDARMGYAVFYIFWKIPVYYVYMNMKLYAEINATSLFGYIQDMTSSYVFEEVRD